MVDHSNPWNQFIDRFKEQVKREGGRKNLIPTVQKAFRNIANWGIDTGVFMLGLQDTVRSMNDILTDDELEKLNQDILELRSEYNDYLQNLEYEEERFDEFDGRRTLAAGIGTAASDQQIAKAAFDKKKTADNERVKKNNKEKSDKLKNYETALNTKTDDLTKAASKVEKFEADKLRGIFGV